MIEGSLVERLGVRGYVLSLVEDQCGEPAPLFLRLISGSKLIHLLQVPMPRWLLISEGHRWSVVYAETCVCHHAVHVSCMDWFHQAEYFSGETGGIFFGEGGQKVTDFMECPAGVTQ